MHLSLLSFLYSRRVGLTQIGVAALGLVPLGFGLALSAHSLLAQTLPLPAALTPLNSPTGQDLLSESEAIADFVPLMAQYVTQQNQAFCGIASMVMVLNSLNITAPYAPEWSRNYFTQDNIFNSETEAIIPRTKIARQGLTLAELAGIFASYPVQVERHHGSDVSLDQFRQLLVTQLTEPDSYVVVNYLRRAIGQERGGHISPLAAYDTDTDQVLILDVSRYKYPPVWVSVEMLWEAINTVDSVSGLTRGIVIVSSS